MTGARLRSAVLVGIALAVASYFALRPTDESRIRAQLAKLAVAVRITEADMQMNPIGRLAHLSGAFETLFEPDVRVSVPEVSQLQSGRRNLVEAMTAAPRYVRTFDVDFASIKVKFDDSGTGAAVGAIAKVKALDRDGRAREDRRAVDFRFAKQDGDWLITTVTVWPKADASPE